MIVIVMIYHSLSASLFANNDFKKAFLEGIEASLRVLSYEKTQALKPIDKGYCAKITTSVGKLDIEESVKLESLALYFHLKPAMFERGKDNFLGRKFLCLDVDSQKENIIYRLKKVSKAYPKLKMYNIQIEPLPNTDIYRIVPVIGRYSQILFSVKKDSSISLDEDVAPLMDEVKKPYEVKQITNLTRLSKTPQPPQHPYNTPVQNSIVTEKNEKPLVSKSTLDKVFFIDNKKRKISVKKHNTVVHNIVDNQQKENSLIIKSTLAKVFFIDKKRKTVSIGHHKLRLIESNLSRVIFINPKITRIAL